tara:strand:- start:648 stop:932 length:285 start_codon:yes stop_codon:yes gene_type:complete
MKKTVDAFLDLDVQIKALTKKRNALRAKLLDARGPGDFIPGSAGLGVTIVMADRTTIDSKAFKAELPELAARFSKTSTSISLRISDTPKAKVAA